MKIKFADGKTQEVTAFNLIEVEGRQLFAHPMVYPNGAIDKRFVRLSDVKTGVAITGGFSFQFSAINFAKHVLSDAANIAKLEQYERINF